MKKYYLLILFFVINSVVFASNVQNESAPTNKKIIQLIFENHQILLNAQPSCTNVGTNFSDTTIGDYVSGFLAYFSETTGKNRLYIVNEPHSLGRKIKFEIGKIDGNDVWAWGVSFIVSKDKKQIVKGSMRCIGAG